MDRRPLEAGRAMIHRNLSTPDRWIRILLGTLMLAAGWSGLPGGLWKIALQVFGWVPLVTGLAGWCPVYALLGISTFKPGRAPED